MRLSLIAPWLLAVWSVAGCNKGAAPPPKFSPEMEEQLQLTAMNTNRSVFTAPLDPVELKRVHLVDTPSAKEWSDQIGDNPSEAEFKAAMAGIPWMLETPPFLHCTGAIVLTFTTNPSEGMPEINYESAGNMEFEEWMFSHETRGRILSVDSDGTILADSEFKKYGTTLVVADPFHNFAILSLSMNQEHLEDTLNNSDQNSLDFYDRLANRYDLVAFSPAGEELVTKRDLNLGFVCAASKSGVGFFAPDRAGDTGYSETLTMLTPDLRQSWSSKIGVVDLDYAGDGGSWALSEDRNGYIFLSRNGAVQAHDNEGKRHWDYAIADSAEYPLALHDDGSLVVVTDDSYETISSESFDINTPFEEVWAEIRVAIFCLEAEGAQRWKAALNANRCSPPAVNAEGITYVALQLVRDDGESPLVLAAINSTGKIDWSETLLDDAGPYGQESHVSVDGSGNVIASTSTKLFCFDPAGSKLWQLNFEEFGAEAFVILPGNRLFVYGGGEAVVLGERGSSDTADEFPEDASPRESRSAESSLE